MRLWSFWYVQQKATRRKERRLFCGSTLTFCSALLVVVAIERITEQHYEDLSMETTVVDLNEFCKLKNLV
jgi:hypothetical protein